MEGWYRFFFFFFFDSCQEEASRLLLGSSLLVWTKKLVNTSLLIFWHCCFHAVFLQWALIKGQEPLVIPLFLPCSYVYRQSCKPVELNQLLHYCCIFFIMCRLPSSTVLGGVECLFSSPHFCFFFAIGKLYYLTLKVITSFMILKECYFVCSHI